MERLNIEIVESKYKPYLLSLIVKFSGKKDLMDKYQDFVLFLITTNSENKRPIDQYSSKKSSPQTFLYTVLHNWIVNRYRSSLTRPLLRAETFPIEALDDAQLPRVESSDENLVYYDFSRLLAKHKNPKIRKAVELRLQGLTMQEIADKLGLVQTTVTRLFQSLKKNTTYTSFLNVQPNKTTNGHP
jgi:RNA polymerase sigma factor (sigma-70 family)